MGRIAAFPTIHQVVLDDSGPLRYFTFTEAASAGMAVGFAATGVSNAVVPMDATAGEQPIGVAVYDVEAGDIGAVVMDHNIVNMANDHATTAIDAGDFVGPVNSTVQGAVVEIALGQQSADAYYSGIALEDIAGSDVGAVLLKHGIFLDTYEL